jgi:hypothetical protein
MNYKIAVILFIGTLLVAGCKPSADTAKDPNKDDYSYAIGLTIGDDMKKRN